MAYINNSVIIRRYIFAAKVIINEIFQALSVGMRGKKECFTPFRRMRPQSSTLFFMFPSGIHYTQLMLWLIFYGNFSPQKPYLCVHVLVREKGGKEVRRKIITTMMWQLLRKAKSKGKGSLHNLILKRKRSH